MIGLSSLSSHSAVKRANLSARKRDSAPPPIASVPLRNLPQLKIGWQADPWKPISSRSILPIDLHSPAAARIQ